jgi:thioesterase domain-containing protein
MTARQQSSAMMLPADLEAYLHEHIPLSQAMEVSVVSVDEEAVVLRAPLAPNINHRRTAFGGSVATLATLAAWSLLHVRCRASGIDARLVIQRNSMEYERAIRGDFTARADIAAADWLPFTRMFARKGIARIALASVLESEGRVAGRFAGEFVALRAELNDT